VRMSLIVTGTLIAVFGSLWGLRSCQREGWERMLYGPYEGVAFTDDLTNSPASVLTIASHGRLEIYELPSETAPVLAPRSEDGTIQWSRMLVPQRRLDDGRTERAAVRELRLHRVERDRDGYEVFITCDWDWGGREGGLIDLDGDYGFKSFRLSW